MKLKSEFITNSSSASFVVMGISLMDSEISDRLVEFITKKGSEFEPSDDFRENLEILTDGTDLSFSFAGDWDGDSVIVGIKYTKMNDDETLRQFKERAQKQIEESFGVFKKVGHIEEGWMDN